MDYVLPGMEFSTGDIMLHKVYINLTDTSPYYVGWLIIQKVTKYFIDVHPILDESYKKYGHVFTRPILAISKHAARINLRIKFKKTRIDGDTVIYKLNHLTFIPKDNYDYFIKIPFH